MTPDPEPKNVDSINPMLNNATNTIGHYCEDGLPPGYILMASFTSEGHNVRLFTPQNTELKFTNLAGELNVFANGCRAAWAHDERTGS